MTFNSTPYASGNTGNNNNFSIMNIPAVATENPPLQFRNGLSVNLANFNSGVVGEPLFTTDTNEFYIVAQDGSKVKFASYQDLMDEVASLNTAVANAISTAATDATSKANAAEANAKSYADGLVATEAGSRASDVSALNSRIDDVVSNTDASALDSLSEIVTAFQEADSGLQEAITSALGTHTSELAVERARIDTLQGDASVVGSVAKAEADAKAYADGLVSAEATARGTDVSSLQSQIDDLESGSSADLTALTTRVATEESTRASEDARILAEAKAYSDNKDHDQSAINTSVDSINLEPTGFSNVQESLETLKGSVDTNTADISANATSIQNILDTMSTDAERVAAVSALTTAFQQADQTLDGALTASITTNADNITSLQDDLATETSTRNSDDQALLAYITAVDAKGMNGGTF